MAERRSRVRRWQLVTRFAAASLVVFVVIGAGISILISRQLVRRERENAESHAEFVTKSILRSELSPQDLSFLSPMGGQRYQEMLAFVQGRILQYPLVMVQIWRSDGTVVFSSDQRMVGRRVTPIGPELWEAFKGGRTVSAVRSTRDIPVDRSVKGLPDRVLETYVPVFIFQGRNEGAPVAVVESYTDYAIVQAQVDQVFKTVLMMLVGGLAVLFLLLLPIARRVSRRLQEQTVRLGELLSREQAAQSERRGLLDRTLRAVEEERTRISADLHDGPVQRLARIGYGLERVRMRMAPRGRDGAGELLAEMQQAVFDEVGDLRRLMTRLRPPVLDQRGLEDAIRDRAHAIEREFGIHCVVEADLERRLAPGLETVLYRVSQEALTNVVKHAGARQARVGLFRDNGSVVLEVDDDGTGFETAGPTPEGDHFGLLAMRERVEMAGGTWALDTMPGRGTRIRAVLPALESER
jgi:two-component system, NarL family, sensor kinase